MTISNLNSIQEKSLRGLRITLSDIEPLIKSLNTSIFSYSTIGYSEENKLIYRIKLGKGSIKVLLWTQMHGDESTATKSVFDLFNIVNSKMFTNVTNQILDKCTIYVVPILNPDGAHRYTRENALNADLNRDAVSLKYKESQVLIEQVSSLKPDYAFNLHDQTAYYSVSQTENPATLSFLAPAYDTNKSINDTRTRAMRIIASMNQALQQVIPNQIGRYNDTYCPNCFGDTIQGMGIPTILIESGYYPNDLYREITRNLHTLALLTAFQAIVEQDFPTVEAYFDIPLNGKKYYDVKYDNILFNNSLTSIGVRYQIKYRDGYLCKIIDNESVIKGDKLEQMYYHEVIDAKGRGVEDFFMIKI